MAYTEAQERLLRAALETIYERGIEHTTTRRIAERAGMNLQLIQYYFGGKEGLIGEAQRFTRDWFFERLGSDLSEAPSLGVAVRRGVDATWELALKRPEMVQPDLLLQARRLERLAPGESAPRDVQERVEALLQGVMDRTGERLRVPLPVFSTLLVAGLSGLLLEHHVTGDQAAITRATQLLGDLLETQVEAAAGGSR